MKHTDERAAKARRASRADRFFGAFLFTENGRPKSSLMIYTFFLSTIALFIYGGLYWLWIDVLTDPLKVLPYQASNLIIAAAACIPGTMIWLVPHRLLHDRRLVPCTFLWLVFYALVVLVTMLILLRGSGGAGAFLSLYAFVVLPPALCSAGMAAVLLRGNRKKRPPLPEQEPEWKKYVYRR